LGFIGLQSAGFWKQYQQNSLQFYNKQNKTLLRKKKTTKRKGDSSDAKKRERNKRKQF